MTARTWTREELVALIESAEVQIGISRTYLRVPTAEKTHEPEAAADADDEPMRIARSANPYSLDRDFMAAAIRAYGQGERERALREALDCCCDVYSAQDVSKRLRALLGGEK